MARLPQLKNGLRAFIRPRVFLLGLLLLLLAFGGYKAQRVWRLMRSLQGHLDQLQAAADGSADLGLDAVGESLQGARADLEALQSEVAPFLPLTRFLVWVPGVGGDLRAAPLLLDVALPVAEAGVIAIATNEGIRLELHDAQGPCVQRARWAVITDGKNTVSGCWVPQPPDQVAIAWLDGDYTLFPISVFREPEKL